jgi:hypothetical protein
MMDHDYLAGLLMGLLIALVSAVIYKTGMDHGIAQERNKSARPDESAAQVAEKGK